MYSSAENAFGALDFTGTGYISEDAFLDSVFAKERSPFSREQIQAFFREFNLFNKDGPGLAFDNFKKVFFPHLYTV